jgi:hypothetical protein
MSTAKDITDHFINRARNLQEFTVYTTIPHNFRLNGVVPFDITIKDDELKATVWAVNFDEAVSRLDTWLENC